MKLTLYTTGCENCRILEQKLQKKGMKYTIIEGEEAIIGLGMSSAPILKVDDELLVYWKAVKFLNSN